MTDQPTIRDVRRYWDTHPLFSHEVADVGSAEWFDAVDRIKRTDVERFNTNWWEFDAFSGQSVLEVGCGPGWYAVNYALGGARTSAVDLTPTATRLTRDHATLRGTTVRTVNASAESLPFADASFDFVISSGVLHHTPDTPGAIAECARVTRPGGRAKIALYHRGLLHSPLCYPLVRFAANRMGAAHPAMRQVGNVDDFIRQYDGAGNPIGIADTTRGWTRLCEAQGFRVRGTVLYFFPKRFMPAQGLIPDWLHRLLDRNLGTMIGLDLVRSVGGPAQD